MVALVTGHARRLSFGLLTAFASSFGQTFFIALTVPYLLAELTLGEARFGLIYAGATLVGGLSLPMVGRLIDRVPLRLYTSLTLGSMGLAALVMAASHHVAALAVALVGLRLAGQGLLGHISATTMAREFDRDRGKALGVASLGYPLGEALLPATFVLTAALLGWRGAWVGVSVVTVLALIPVCWWLGSARPGPVPVASNRVAVEDRLTARALLADPGFRLVLPAVLVTPLVLTALFLYQAVLGAAKGWSPAWLATAFTGYAIARASASLCVGPLIDRWSAHVLLPLYLLPLAAGLGVLAIGGPLWTALLYLVLVGISTGASSSVLSALWAEMYGPAQVAAVRSLTSGFTIVATAVSPALFGLLIERGVGAGAIQYGGLALTLGAAGLAHVAVRARHNDAGWADGSFASRRVA